MPTLARASIADGDASLAARKGIVYWFVTNKYVARDPNLHALEPSTGRSSELPIRAASCQQLLAAEGGLYWVEESADTACILRLPMDESDPVDLLRHSARALATGLSVPSLHHVDSELICFSHSRGCSLLRRGSGELHTIPLPGESMFVHIVVADDLHLYVLGGETLYRTSRTGKHLQVVREGLACAGIDNSSHCDAHEIYLAVRSGIIAVRREGGEVRIVVDCSKPARRKANPVVSYLRFDNTHAYWVEGDRILAISKAGREPLVIKEPAHVVAMALDDSHLYWVDRRGTISATEKPGLGAPAQSWGQHYEPPTRQATRNDPIPPSPNQGPECSGCRTSVGEAPMLRSELAAALGAAGLFGHGAGSEDYFFHDRYGRTIRADGEDIEEGGAGTVLRRLAPFLARQGVKLGTVVDDVGAEYGLRIGSTRYVLRGKGESDATAGLVRLVNQLLAGAGSEERLHVLGGGNDQWLTFLTAQQCWLIRRSGEVEGDLLRTTNPSRTCATDGQSQRWQGA